LAQAEREYAKHKQEKDAALLRTLSISDLGSLDEEIREIWQSDKMRVQDKKRIIRCLIDEVTITRGEDVITLGIIFRTGATTVVECGRIKKVWEDHTSKPETVDFIREKAVTNTVNEISDMLNQEGCKTGTGLDFSPRRLQQLMKQHEIPRLEDYLRKQGYVSSNEKAESMGISTYKLNLLREQGELSGDWKIVDGRSACMYSVE